MGPNPCMLTTRGRQDCQLQPSPEHWLLYEHHSRQRGIGKHEEKMLQKAFVHLVSIRSIFPSYFGRYSQNDIGILRAEWLQCLARKDCVQL
jgi:hypothetical protein